MSKHDHEAHHERLQDGLLALNPPPPHDFKKIVVQTTMHIMQGGMFLPIKQLMRKY